MSRIEKVWGSVFGATAVKRKDGSEKEDASKRQDREQRKDPERDDSEEQRAVDRAAVEKAVRDLEKADDFSHTGMKVETFMTKEGMRVKLAHASGATIKVMSAEEFLKLRESAALPTGPGKILDQKY